MQLLSAVVVCNSIGAIIRTLSRGEVVYHMKSFSPNRPTGPIRSSLYIYLLDPVGSLDIGKMSGCLYVCMLPKPPI